MAELAAYMNCLCISGYDIVPCEDFNQNICTVMKCDHVNLR